MAKLLISALLAAALTPTVACAEDFYVGATAAKGGDLTHTSPITGKTDTASANTAVKLFGGINYSDALGFEVGYGQAGNAHFNKTTLGLPNDPTFKIHTVTAAARLAHHFNDAWSVFGKAGVAYNRFKATDGAGTSDSVSSTKPLLSVGMAYNATKAIALTVEYEHIGSTSKPGLLIKQNSVQFGARVNF